MLGIVAGEIDIEELRKRAESRTEHRKRGTRGLVHRLHSGAMSQLEILQNHNHSVDNCVSQSACNQASSPLKQQCQHQSGQENNNDAPGP